MVLVCVLGLVPAGVSVATADDPGGRRADAAPAPGPLVQDPREAAPHQLRAPRPTGPGTRADAPFRMPQAEQRDGPEPVPMPRARAGSRPVPIPRAELEGQQQLTAPPPPGAPPGPLLEPGPRSRIAPRDGSGPLVGSRLP